MKKQLCALGLLALLGLVGCASPSRAEEAIDICIEQVEEELRAEVDDSAVEATNTGDAMFEEGVVDRRDVDDANAMFAVTGDVTWINNDQEFRKSLLCLVKFEDGEPRLELEPSLS